VWVRTGSATFGGGGQAGEVVAEVDVVALDVFKVGARDELDDVGIRADALRRGKLGLDWVVGVIWKCLGRREE